MELEFKFTRPLVDSVLVKLPVIRDTYKVILAEYFKTVFNLDNIELSFENMTYIKEDKSRFLEIDDLKIRNQDVEISGIHWFLSHTSNTRVVCYANTNGGKYESREQLFEFYIYDQNNCCGAMSCSATTIKLPYRNHKLGQILQYMKEDIAIVNRVSKLYCTDTYHKTYNLKTNHSIEDLKPYLPNTNILLKSGFKVIDLFFNRRSNNVVAMFSKDIPATNEQNRNIVMKITPVKEQLVEIKNIKVGCDPELFLRNKKTQQFIPSFYVMKGNKYAPVSITEKGHNIQCDNVMVEYGVPPSETAQEFVDNNLLVQNYLKDKVAEPNGLELVIFPSAQFAEEHLGDSKAKEFGCDPDFDVWNDGKPNIVGESVDGLRTAGGHIHVGYDNHNRVTSNYIIKALDLFISVPLVKMEPNNRRKEMYGKAGAFRPQPWGVEYRVTSNYIYSSPELMTWAFNQVQKAIKFINDGNTKQLDAYGSRIVEAINLKHNATVNYLVDKFNLEVLKPVEAK